MNTYFRFPFLTKQIFITFLISSTILLVGLVVFELTFFQINPNMLSKNLYLASDQEKLNLFEKNTLIPSSNPANPEPKVVQRFLVIVTAYSSTPWETEGNPFVTASGTWVEDGIIANNLLPFGTKIKLPEIYGDKVFTVQDRMHWRKGYYHIDIWFPSYWQAKNFGAKRTYVEVLEG